MAAGPAGFANFGSAAPAEGKRGGVRAIYYWYDEGVPIYALLVYGKGERDELTPGQTKAVASQIPAAGKPA